MFVVIFYIYLCAVRTNIERICSIGFFLIKIPVSLAKHQI